MILTASSAIGARMYLLGSYRIVTDDFSPHLLKGDWVLVPRWQAIGKMPIEVKPLGAGDFVVFLSDEGRKRVGRIRVAAENGIYEILADGRARSVSISKIEGRLWRIWFSVGHDGEAQGVRWERVLQSIN